MIIALTTNQAYFGTNRANVFHCLKIDLSQTVLYRNGIPIVGKPIVKLHEKRVYFKTLEDLDFLDKEGHGITFTVYPNNFIMAFDFNSTQEDSHDFIYPELTNCSISVDLNFFKSSAEKNEILLLRENVFNFFCLL